MTADPQAVKQRRVRDGVGFFRTFLKSPGSVGAVLPSSRWLARVLVGRLDELEPGDLVVEYGPGTGPMTAAIRAALPDGVRYLGIELDTGFHELLERRFPTLDFHHGSAADVTAILSDRGLPMPKRILSGLPFASLPAAVQSNVVSGIVDSLRESGGEFRTFQYVHAYGLASARRFRALMRERFASFERIGPIVRNVPPAFVLRYRDAR
ncbi:MAG: phospholipid methyltransferase [bacterium]|nr:phospholipid methyltransferase [bacterium]